MQRLRVACVHRAWVRLWSDLQSRLNIERIESVEGAARVCWVLRRIRRGADTDPEVMENLALVVHLAQSSSTKGVRSKIGQGLLHLAQVCAASLTRTTTRYRTYARSRGRCRPKTRR